ncbi:hypothetical protein CAOG_06845 [Capsaspora owczarzaki ATCC 30864]|uniref:AMP-dependent synthetase/ligase domain-containing protein n=1 Tax=Capsaspora owczarzaki (strain ATCC 30864) TaxID=595528 RepID=A0A0D2WVZ2_CAPO3|nr:hypothetical protein CAOG_06845 [Capsaspora owczarzaki ATCC 30864]KJE96538.1 hypothetical protein CAOG_006845 [Capsaspora owczarzaki ATCC 30864]|eukprot:XP_004344466.1 hypothetical protein CAOG_06845 [Capsaspora owczarzaki ATCC 30864]
MFVPIESASASSRQYHRSTSTTASTSSGSSLSEPSTPHSAGGGFAATAPSRMGDVLSVSPGGTPTWSSDPSVPVRLRLGTQGDSAKPARTVMEVMRDASTKHGTKRALAFLPPTAAAVPTTSNSSTASHTSSNSLPNGHGDTPGTTNSMTNSATSTNDNSTARNRRASNSSTSSSSSSSSSSSHPATSSGRKLPPANAWSFITYKDYYETVRTAAKAFIALGLEPHHGVCILGFNSPEWFIADLGAIFAGGLGCGIYTTNSPDACQFIIEDSRANIVVVENDTQLQKILKVRHRLPLVKAIIQYHDKLSEPGEGLYSWNEFLSKSSLTSDETLEERIQAQTATHCCTLIYTSGTTGHPKGVMLSHDNLTWTSAQTSKQVKVAANEQAVSYLPLSHVAAQMTDIHMPMLHGATTWFAQADALKGSLVDTLRVVRPTIFLGVPRVWEKMAEQLQAFGKTTSGFSQRVAGWAKEIGLEGNMRVERGESVPWGWSLANALVFSNIRQALGLDRCKIALSSAAPISRETLDYFLSINLPLFEIYGMSESTGPHTVSVPGQRKTGFVGVTFDGAETRIHRPGLDGSGEICFRGRHIFMGYLGHPEKTAEVVDGDGWLHSGDVGQMFEGGFVQITGRIKELLITAGGENVAPTPIEQRIKQVLPFVSNAMLIGDRRKFISCLLTLRCEFDAEGNALSQLNHTALVALEQAGVPNTVRTIPEALEHPAFNAALEQGMRLVNELSESHAQHVQKWVVLPMDFTTNGGELGPTLKLRRHVVMQKYQLLIDSMYGAFDQPAAAK